MQSKISLDLRVSTQQTTFVITPKSNSESLQGKIKELEIDGFPHQEYHDTTYRLN